MLEPGVHDAIRFRCPRMRLLKKMDADVRNLDILKRILEIERS
jgi:hypothetical protein